MSQKDRDNSRWFGSRIGPILTVATVAVAFCGLPALSQPTTSPTTGHMVTTRPMAPGRPTGIPAHGGQRFGTPHVNSFGAGRIHANSFGAPASPPPPSWELPRTVIPHWEIPSNIPIQPNAVQGNPIPRQRHGFGRGVGVGYVGLPYYVDPMAFVNADSYQENDAAQQTQPSAPARPDYAPQAPYEEGSEGPYRDQGYAAPPRRAPYNPEAYPPPAQSTSAAESAAVQNDGLDHPAVTLVFNNGRPPMQVHSYVLTSSSVLIAESGHQRVIPVADLDLPATIAQNREAGVDFQLPGGRK
jgi:hypothetical protein